MLQGLLQFGGGLIEVGVVGDVEKLHVVYNVADVAQQRFAEPGARLGIVVDVAQEGDQVGHRAQEAVEVELDRVRQLLGLLRLELFDRFGGNAADEVVFRRKRHHLHGDLEFGGQFVRVGRVQLPFEGAVMGEGGFGNQLLVVVLGKGGFELLEVRGFLVDDRLRLGLRSGGEQTPTVVVGGGYRFDPGFGPANGAFHAGHQVVAVAGALRKQCFSVAPRILGLYVVVVVDLFR